MKLRQKLAAVLAASMIVTAVPVVTMAATSNSLNVDVKIREGSTLGFNKTAKTEFTYNGNLTTGTSISVNNPNGTGSYQDRHIPNLELYPKDDYRNVNESFFINLEDGKFSYAAFLSAYVNLGSSSFDELSDLAGANSVVELVNERTKADETYILNGNTASSMFSMTAEERVNQLGAELVFDNNSGGTATISLTSEKQMRVDLSGTWLAADRNNAGTPIILPLFVQANGTQVKVHIDGDSSFVTSETKTIGVANEDGKEVTITANDAKVAIPVDGGEISTLTLTEEVLGAITDSENRQIRLELPTSSDLEWKTSGIKATGKRAFASNANVDVKVEAQYGKSGRGVTDKQVLIIELPNWSDTNARGVIELSGISVRPTDEVAKTGELEITVSPVNDKDFTKEKSLTVGVVTEYGVELTTEKPATIKAGRSGIVNKYSVTAVLSENVKDSIVTGRDIKFTLENGYIISAADIYEWVKEEKYVFNSSSNSSSSTLTPQQQLQATLDQLLALIEGQTSSLVTSTSGYKKLALETIQNLVKKQYITFGKDGKHAEITDVEVNKLGQVIGFTVDGESINDTDRKEADRFHDEEKDALSVKLPVATSLQSSGEVTLVASGRALAELGQENKVSCKIADIVEPIKVEMTAAELKVGLQSQTAGSITISETDKGMIEKGTLVVNATQEGIKFQGVPKVEATNLKVGDVELSADKKLLLIEVEKTSTEAGKISITDVEFTTDRTVPEGTFPVEFYGSALTDEDLKIYSNVTSDKYVVNDFIRITTPNTEDIKNGALKAVTSVFTLDSNKYTVDGVEYEMDAKAYAEDGRTMVPVRYIAKAFGIAESNVLYNNQVATIIAGEKIIQVRMGSNILTVNGAQVEMDTKAVVKEGRAYVPMKFIAAALGVNVSYDSAAKTATFSNKN